MAFPTTLTNATDNVTDVVAAHLNNLEAKVGIDSSAVATSIDYLLKNAASSNPGHTHTASSIANRTRTIFIPIDSFGTSGGTFAVVAGNDGFSYISIPATSGLLYCSILIPADYVSAATDFKDTVYWYSPTATSGDVVFNHGFGKVAAGANIETAGINFQPQTVAVPGADLLVVSTNPGGPAPVAGEFWKFGLIADPQFADVIRIVGVSFSYTADM